jgi:hypothetical protein
LTHPTCFDRQTANLIKNEIADALSVVAEKWGVLFTDAVGSFSNIELNSKLKVKILDIASVEKENKTTFKRCCFIFGLKPHHYGTTLWIGQTNWELVGIDANRPKQPFLIKSVRTGKLRRYSAFATESIKRAYDRANPKKAK